MTEETNECGSTDTDDGTPCERPVGPSAEACYLHRDSDGPPKGHGAPEGNNHAEGNGGGAPEGNMNSVEHGVNMSFQRRMELLREHGTDEEIELFREYYDDYASKAESKSTAAQLAVAEVFEVRIEERLFEDDLWFKAPVVDDNGDPIKDPDTGQNIMRKHIRKGDIDTLTGFLRELRLSRDYAGINNDGSSSSSGHSNRHLLWEDKDDENERETPPPEESDNEGS